MPHRGGGRVSHAASRALLRAHDASSYDHPRHRRWPRPAAPLGPAATPVRLPACLAVSHPQDLSPGQGARRRGTRPPARPRAGRCNPRRVRSSALFEGWESMQTKVASAVLTALLLAGCATTTPAPRFSAVSPADKDGPEAAVPPAILALAGETGAQPVAPPEDAPKPAAGHDGHSVSAAPATPAAHEGHAAAAPATPSPADQPYSCPMHPEVKRASPGSCPECGKQLLKRKDAREQP